MISQFPTYRRCPSEGLLALMANGGILSSLGDLPLRAVGGHLHDVHFRSNDEVHVYRGLTVVLKIRRHRRGGLSIVQQANSTGDLPRGLERANDPQRFQRALEECLTAARVGGRHTEHEGQVQLQWSRVTQPWTPFDREGRLGYRSTSHRTSFKSFAEVEKALSEIAELVDAASGTGRWARPEIRGAEVDQLAVDQAGRLVLIELKDASKQDSQVYYSPFQLLQYLWEWHTALPGIREDVQCVIDARVSVGLLPPEIPPLSGGVRGCVAFGADQRSPEVRHLYEEVLDVVNRHLPEDVGAIETWTHDGTAPKRVS